MSIDETGSTVTLVGLGCEDEPGPAPTWVTLADACARSGYRELAIYRGAALRLIRVKIERGATRMMPLYALEDVLAYVPPRTQYRRKGAKLASP
jgi:hypothetical protein